MKRVPTVGDRVLERARISTDDMQQAIAFIDAALALDDAKAQSPSPDPARDIARLALEMAAIIHYARPFTFNERKRKKRRAAANALGTPAVPPRLGSINLGSLEKVLATKQARSLHRNVLFIRHNIVAHANSRYFKTRLVKGFLPKESGAQDFSVELRRTYPRVNLNRLRSNAHQLGAVFGMHGHMAALSVRQTRKRLRS